jgi:O-antigen/teichoic acid export membrane protein
VDCHGKGRVQLASLDIKAGIKTVLPIFVSLAGSGFLAFLTQILLGHSLTVEEFGIVSTAVSVGVIMAAAIGFGMPSVWLLIFGQKGWQAFPWVRRSLTFLMVWGPIVLALSWMGLLWFFDDPRSLKTIGWLQAMVVMQVMVELLTTKLQLEARYLALSIWQILPHLGRLIVAAAVYFSAASSVDLVAKGYCAISMVLIVASGIGLLSLTPSRMQLSGHTTDNPRVSEMPSQSVSYRELFDLAWPYAGTAALVILYGRVDIVLLGGIVSPTAAGQFSVAAAFLLVAFLVPQALYQKFLLPKIHRWFYSDWQKFLSVYRLGCAVMTILGIALTGATYLGGQPLVNLFFGEKYKESGEILSLLSVCIVIRFISSSFESALMSGDYRKHRLYCQAVSTGIGVSSAYILIVQYGLNGAIISRIATELTLLVGYCYASSRYVLGAKAWSGWSLKLNQG